MKKILLLLTILLLTTTTATAILNKGLTVNSIQINENLPGEPLFVNVHTSSENFQENVKVKAYFLDDPYYTSNGPFDIGTSKHKSSLILNTPDYGCHLLRISVSNDEVKRIKHRWVCV